MPPASSHQKRLADRARVAVAAHAATTGVSPEEPLSDRVVDLLVNLRHLAAVEGLNWSDVLTRADTYFTEEANPMRRSLPIAMQLAIPTEQP